MRNTKLIILYLFLAFSCVDQARLDKSFIIATYDDVKDWDPATAFSLEVLPMSNIYEPLYGMMPALILGSFSWACSLLFKKF